MAEDFFVPTATSNTATLLPSSERFVGQTYHSPSYYRSNLFTLETASCGLIQAALPLISLLIRLPRETASFNLEELYTELCHEMNAFTCQLQSFSYPFETLVASRYLLCVTFDYVIAHLNADNFIHWQKFLLVAHPQNLSNFDLPSDEFSHEDNFFKICENLIAKPEDKEDLLELCYLCLLFGFKKINILEHTLHTREVSDLNKLLEEIYSYLYEKRQNTPCLFEPKTVPILQYEEPQKKFSIPRPLSITLITLSSVLLGYYLTLSQVFYLVMRPLLNQINTLS